MQSCKSKKDIGINKSIDTTMLEEKQSFNFPEDWLGYWEGELEIFNSKGLQQTIPMALDHRKSDEDGVYIWAIIYGEDTIAGRRDYLLRTVDSSLGHYQTDEKNGIILDAFLMGDELISVFSVMGNNLTSIYERSGDYMNFEILMSKSDTLTVTGNTIEGEETTPEVISFEPRNRQKARLKRR